MNIQQLMRQLELHEGFRSKPYKDSVGVLTIGIGRNLDHVGISRDEALYMLENDIEKCIQAARRYDWYPHLSEMRQRVVVDMIFNLGEAGFSKFKRTIGFIADGNYEQAAKNMLKSKWAKQVGRRAITLSKMMETDGEVK